MYILLTIFENSAPLGGNLHSHYATILTLPTTDIEFLWEKLFFFTHQSRNKLRSSLDGAYPPKRICSTDRVLFNLLSLLQVLHPTGIENAELRQDLWLDNTCYRL